MKKILLLFLIIPLLILFHSCKENNDSINSPIDLLIDDYDNIPVKVNTENSFTFTVSAYNFNYILEDNLIFTGDSVVFAITLSNTSSTNSQMILFNENSSIIFEESLNKSKVLVDENIISDTPERIKIELSDFTGKLTIVVAIDDN